MSSPGEIPPPDLWQEWERETHNENTINQSAEEQNHREKRDHVLCCLGLSNGTADQASEFWVEVNTALTPRLSSSGMSTAGLMI